MISKLRRAICRAAHGGFYYSRVTGECGWTWTSKYLTLTCKTKFRNCEESGLLKEFEGRVRLDEHRMLDLEDQRIRTFWCDGYRVTQGGKIISEWGQPPARKILKPIPISLVNRSQAGTGKR